VFVASSKVKAAMRDAAELKIGVRSAADVKSPSNVMLYASSSLPGLRRKAADAPGVASN
jgi:hypothetical protein